MSSAAHPHEFGGLLRAVITDPNNDTQRLKYARHLERDGVEKERALLIRVQVALAKLPSSDHPEWLRLASISRKIELEKAAAWIPEWYGAEGIKEVQFHRGFIECVTIPGATLLHPATRKRLFESAPVRHLNITDLDGDGDLRLILDGFLSGKVFGDTVFGESVASRILSLDLDGQNLTDDSIQHLGQYGLKNLRWLSIAHNRIGEIGVRALAEDSTGDWPYLKNLAFVNFEGNPINPVERVYEDQGVVVDQHTPTLQYHLPRARWLKQNIVAGRALIPDRFSLSSGSAPASTIIAIGAQ